MTRGSSWPHSRSKRILDILVALIVALPAVLIVVMLSPVLMVSTHSWPLFFQERVGRDGVLFSLVKLRTMRNAAGSHVTTGTDRRITVLGTLVRRAKVDEIPQFWNVLRGEMSLVGPRPDVPGYLDVDTSDDARSVAGLRPGITGLASLAFRDEEIRLSTVAKPAEFNDLVLWPTKVAINRQYAAHATWACDLRIVLSSACPWISLRECCLEIVADQTIGTWTSLPETDG